MMKTTLKFGLWALLLVGAYLAGAMRSRGPSPSPDASLTGRELKDIRPSVVGVTGRNVENPTASRRTGFDPWLETFFDASGRLSSSHIEEAVAAVLAEADPVTAMRRFSQLLEALTPENASAALEALKASGGGGNVPQFMGLLAHAWGRMDGQAAVAAFAGLKGAGAEAARTNALAAWASADPEAALHWWKERASSGDPAGNLRENADWCRGLLTGLARNDMEGAMRVFLTLSEGEQRSYVGVLVEAKLREGVEAGAEWALQLPDEPLRTTALESVGGRFLRQDLDAAREWARSLADRPDAHEAVADVANALASRDPAEAVAWVSKLPAGPSQDHAYEDLFENWTRSDSLAASQSLTTMETGPARDTAIQAFSRTLAGDNPEDALVWAATITDAGRRADVQLELARRWQRSDPAQAGVWIAANLPADLTARVIPVAR